MSKKNTEMTFNLDRVSTTNTEEEKEILDILNRKMHLNDLEDDFFNLAQGIRDNQEDNDSTDCSSIEDSFEGNFLEQNEEEDIEECSKETADNQTDSYSCSETDDQTDNTHTETVVPSLADDRMNALIAELNAKSQKGFEALSSMSQKPAPVKRKSKWRGTNIDECNAILNRMASSYMPNYLYEENTAPAAKKPKYKTVSIKKTQDIERCDNWEDIKPNHKNRPNII
ncbi:hypothetical protein NEOKW01_1266 [Nematocida sp. AWRm80]|nr:hypothetical protein NEOKW01_1266 [Nematocida sp. AWRm80]